MSNIKNFLKTYKTWILVGIILGLIFILVIWLVSNKEENIVEEGTISNPYFVQKTDIKIEIDKNTIDVPSDEVTFKVSGDNRELFVSFINRFYDYNDENLSEYYLEFEKNIFSYSKKTRIITVRPKNSLSLRFGVTSKEAVKGFFVEYFNIENIMVTSESETENGYEYKGKLIFENKEIGSTFLDGESFVIVIDDEGNLQSLSFLLINEESVEVYQGASVVDIFSLVRDPKYPKLVMNKEIEERYYNQSPLLRGSSILTEFYTRNLYLLYLFVDSENGYVLPTYKLEGDGILINSQNEKFWSSTHIYICAISPRLLLERELPAEEVFSEPSSPE